MTDLTTELPTTEPYPFATILAIKPDGNHELLVAVVAQSDPPRCGDGYRYSCLFQFDGHRPQVAKVYSDEIKAVTGLDTNGDILCNGCADSTHNRCVAQGITPATCA